ncbi:glycosyl transferase family 1 [Acinetobacter baumannii]|uniref:glycosyl transferase family 1 n=1 Tax=Acinetobacter baumannii TaxID=470 RepID=UPI001CDC4227|nr:glycosyl transferase family 1 [Acinetobacter baumannii]MCA4192111.1 glycosyl transferase family 1 [Acinetobacter baumannii]
MNNILMILKTQNLKNDQRVLKEIKSLTLNGANVEVFVAKNCDMTQEELHVPMCNVNIIGGAAPNNLIIRIIGVIHFYILNLVYLITRKKNFEKVWICDPIMFGLVILLHLFSPKTKIIWDHHELPPKWFLNNRILMSLFKKAYLASDIVIHANESRRNYLEKSLGVQAKKIFILSNYPLINMGDEEILNEKAEQWILENKFIYLQNSLQDNRYGANVIRAAINAGYNIFHAGKVNQDYIEKNNLDKSKIFSAGYLNIKQINRVLNKCVFTVILYKQDSLNQTYCDANRLYQAMALGVPVVVGNNPTLIETTKSYKNCMVLDNDGGDEQALYNTIVSFELNIKSREPMFFHWSDFDFIFQELVHDS